MKTEEVKRVLKVLDEIKKRFKGGELDEIGVKTKNSGVYTDGEKYWVRTDVNIVVSTRGGRIEVHDFSEEVPSGKMWTSNSTGSKLEELVNDFVHDLHEMAISMAEKLLAERLKASKIELDDPGQWMSAVRGGYTLYVKVAEFDESHATGTHIWSDKIFYPDCVEVSTWLRLPKAEYLSWEKKGFRSDEPEEKAVLMVMKDAQKFFGAKSTSVGYEIEDWDPKTYSVLATFWLYF